MKLVRVLTVCAIALVAATCSRSSPERTMSATPTAPSALAGASLGAGVSGPLDVAFPARSDAFDFRNQLETKYASGLQRAAAPTFVDREGEVVWLEEYIRYRVNGCDHTTAAQKVLAEVDGGAASAVCSTTVTSETAAFPARSDVVDFRRQLESKYQGFGRGASSSAVDGEGAAIWTAEYLRYRTSSCDHTTAVQKVFSQIDGNGVAATCTVACTFRVFVPIVSVSAMGGAASAELLRDSGSCTWAAVSEASWITLSGATTGADRELQGYTVAANTGAPRTGYIRFNFTGGHTRLEVNQASSPYNLSFEFYEPSTSTSPTTECRLRTASTTCALSAATNALPEAIATYDWRVEYSYGGAKVRTQTSAASVFAFTESCGSSDAGGTVIPIAVTLTVTDTAGNTATIYSGQGFQPALQLRTFNCS